MTQLPVGTLRWHDYVLERGTNLPSFWAEHFADGDVSPLFVMAKSFDPRTCTALEQLIEHAGLKKCDALLVEYDSGDDSAPEDEDLVRRASQNHTRIRELLDPLGTITPFPLKTDSDGQRRSTAQSARNVFRSFSAIAPYSDILVDISGMPRSVFFPLISTLLSLIDHESQNGTLPPNLFVLVSEDPLVDEAISHEGIDPFAEFLPYYRGTTERAGDADLPTVWIPILGENRLEQLECIENQLRQPLEVWPVLPSPSREPRRGDDLVIEYQTYLLDNHGIDPRNFIYASEDNPFEVYRQLCRAVHDCLGTLNPLGGCHVVFSALSSKLMSLGSLLAAYDLKRNETKDVGVAHVGCNNYRLNDCVPDTEVFALWLTGRCYETE